MTLRNEEFLVYRLPMFSPSWNLGLNIILLRYTRPSPEVLWFVVTGCCDVLNWAIFTCLSLVHATGAALASLLPGLPPHSPPSHLDLPLKLPRSHISYTGRRRGELEVQLEAQ